MKNPGVDWGIMLKIELEEFVLDGIDWIYVADDSDK